VLEYRANWELHSASAGLEVLSGRIYYPRNPGLKPWAMIYSRFAAETRPRAGSFSTLTGLKRTDERELALPLRVFGLLWPGVIPHKRHYIGCFVDRFGEWFTSSMTGLGIDPDQDWVVTSLSRL
jgi:hypothetical protein